MTSYFDEHNCDPLPDNQAGSGKNFQLKKNVLRIRICLYPFHEMDPGSKKPAKILGI